MCFSDLLEVAILALIEIDRTAMISLVITLAALWQDEEIDHIRPMTDAIYLADTFVGHLIAARMRLSMASFSFAARRDDTLNVYDAKSTMVPRVTMALRGKKEHFRIRSDNNANAAAS